MFFGFVCPGRQSSRGGTEEQASRSVLKIIDEAKRYGEGTGVRIEVHEARDVELVKTLARIKVEN